MAPAAAAAAAAPATTAFSVLTYNTYFSPYRWADRMGGILHMCASIHPQQPHVICLQEVLPQFLMLPGWDAWLAQHGYVSSATDPADLSPYGVLTLAKRELSPEFEAVPLPTRMGRTLLVAHFRDPAAAAGPGTGHWRVGNVHLESLDSAALRREQLAVAGRAMAEGMAAGSRAVICGDFNFDSDRNYDVRPGVPLEVRGRLTRASWDGRNWLQLFARPSPSFSHSHPRPSTNKKKRTTPWPRRSRGGSTSGPCSTATATRATRSTPPSTRCSNAPGPTSRCAMTA